MRVLILDSNPAVREALRERLESERDCVAAPGADIGARAPVDVVVVDERIAGGLSEAARRTLAALSERAPVVVMGAGDRVPYEDAHVAAGAVGYSRKDDVDRLVALARAAGLVAHADRACRAAKAQSSASMRSRAQAR
jgi:DNA-binding NarL/FixJ family response regulator